MKREIFIAVFGLVIAFTVTGCGIKQMPSQERLKTMSLDDFMDQQGFYLNEDKGYYMVRLSKNRNFDFTGSWITEKKELFRKRFMTYCSVIGGKMIDSRQFEKSLYPDINSINVQTIVNGKLNTYVKSWNKISKICVVNDEPLFGYSFGRSFLDNPTAKRKRKHVVQVAPAQFADLGGDPNSWWWNIDIFVVPIKKEDFEEARMFIESYLKHNI
ncbi:LptM family lipoprotein [Thermodesulfatator atlanticus]